MIELSNAQLNRLSAAVTKPCYLVNIELDYQERLSTREAVDLDGLGSWESGRVRIGSLNSERAQIQVRNDDYRYTVNALQGLYQRRPIQILWAYGAEESIERFLPDDYDADFESVGGANISNTILMFDGFVTAVTSVDEWITIEASRASISKYPRLRVMGDTARHVTPSGTVLVFSGETYRVEQRLK